MAVVILKKITIKFDCRGRARKTFRQARISPNDFKRFYQYIFDQMPLHLNFGAALEKRLFPTLYSL